MEQSVYAKMSICLIVMCIFVCFSYGSGYDTLGQQGNKDFSSNYSSNGQSKSTGGSAAAAGTGKGEVPLMHF